MRPIDKGAIPIDNGVAKTVSTHRSWRRNLIDRLGAYCCYCNMRLNDSPQVEHVIAQDIDANRSLDWDNVILACGPCNRTKSNRQCPPTTHYLPEYHNTHLAFDYFVSSQKNHGEPAAYIRPHQQYIDIVKANNTIDLCALDRDTTRTFDQATDLRWKYRFETMVRALILRDELEEWPYINLHGFIKFLKMIVEATGFWSIWYETFIDVLEIRRMLVMDFAGTDQHSFDSTTFLPIPRTPRHAGDSI